MLKRVNTTIACNIAQLINSPLTLSHIPKDIAPTPVEGTPGFFQTQLDQVAELGRKLPVIPPESIIFINYIGTEHNPTDAVLIRSINVALSNIGTQVDPNITAQMIDIEEAVKLGLLSQESRMKLSGRYNKFITASSVGGWEELVKIPFGQPIK